MLSWPMSPDKSVWDLPAGLLSFCGLAPTGS